ncbi:MAG: hypothetical protein ACOC7W_09580, partial [Desulfosalsimonas sp.]
MNDTALKIEDTIRELFEEGIRLGNDVLHYIESMAGAAGPEELLEYLWDQESCDSQSLYQLIFYPDESHQIRLEPLLETGVLSRKDIQA